MSIDTEQNLFELVPLIQNINIKYCTQCTCGVKEILAIVTR